MKKIFSILSLFSIFNCQNMNKKIWYNTGDFLSFEKQANIKVEDAIKIYETNFELNFKNNINIIKDDKYVKEIKRIIYLLGKDYYIGYRMLLDKRGDETVPLKFLAKINSETGEIFVVDSK